MHRALTRRLLWGLSLGGMICMLYACGGEDGADGKSCTVKDNGDGTATITCEDGTSVTVDNGEDGAAGAAGKAGADGDSCTVKDNKDGTKTITCEDGTTVKVSDGKPCTVKDNGDGTKTVTCKDGTVTITDGKNGKTGGNFEITDRHGKDYLQSIDPFTGSDPKRFVNMTITSATADTAGKVTVKFKVADDKKKAVLGIKSINANINKLVAGTKGSPSKWVSYIYREQVVKNSATGNWPKPDGTKADQAYRESGGTLTDNKDGSYTYVFKTDISSVTANGKSIKYDRSLTHRVSLMLGGHSGPTADAVYDFVPDGSTVSTKRNIIDTTACKSCHGWEFHGHGGDRLRVDNCVTCHQPGNIDPHSGETVDFKVMIHKIHAGSHLASIPGVDGIVWDDPKTTVDESADNGSYAIWGYRDQKHTWWKVGFPAEIENCTKCHTGKKAQVDNWKKVPSRAACGSCHDDVNFATGTKHGGGVQTDDSLCSKCHTQSGTSKSVVDAHDWTKKDQRNIPEFDVKVTVSKPANGTHFVKGEAPVVTVVLKDKATGTPINHTKAVEDDAAEGCAKASCPPADGKFEKLYLFVHGPRARRNPVLTTAARVEIVAKTAGPYDLSASGASLGLEVDRGENLHVTKSSGASALISGTISVSVSSGTFANSAAATPQEVVAWLNADSKFKARAIAYLEGGKPAIRSRNLGTFYALQLKAGSVTTAVFGGDTSMKILGGYYAYNAIYKHTDSSKDDPKATWTTGKITYKLDSVDDLEAGTYVARVAATDRGRISGSNYKTPSVAKTTFQVKTKTETKPPAGGCDSCHENSDGDGLVFHKSHSNVTLTSSAVDWCGNCHDYQSGKATGDWFGAYPIAKRVHAVHNGSDLTYPNETVGHADDPVGRNWDITLPQDIRNCEVCHADKTSSGSWKTKPARIPCSGCHDTDAAQTHMNLMTFDPTPKSPWNGDEKESCKVCH